MNRPTRPSSFEVLEDRRLFSIPSSLGGAERASINFTQDWKFIKSDPSNAEDPSTSTSGWSTVDLPHTYNAQDGQDGDGTPAGQLSDGSSTNINQAGGDYYRGATWYRKTFTYGKSWNTRRIYINVEAAAIKADLYVNGQYVTTHKGDYSGWTADITKYVNGSGKTNTVAIRVDNSFDNTVAGFQGDFTKFGGLTRGVTIFATNKTHVNSASYGASGIKLSQTSVSSSSATLNIGTGMRNDALHTVGVSVRTSLVDAKGKVVKSVTSPISLTKHKSKTVYSSLTIANPHLWNGTSDPYLYTVYVQVVAGKSVIDTMTQTVGFRSFETTSTAAYLNGKKIQLRGANLHDDREDEGPATTYDQKYQDLKLLKDMGANAVRFAHWQVDDDYYTIADQLGLLVWTEIPLWGGNVNTASTAFNDNAEQQLRELIRQNYNHSSIVYWGLFNEIDNSGANISLIDHLNDVAHSEDATRQTIAASDENNDKAINATTDLVTLNKYYGWYAYGGDGSQSADARIAQLGGFISTNKSQLPNQPVGLGEYGAGANIDQHIDWDDVQSAAGTDPNADQTQPEEYQAYLHEKSWQQIRNSSTYVWAAFIWELADNANDDRMEGSMPGMNTKGLVSYDRKTLKDSYYYYKTQWSRTPTLWLTSKDYTDRSSTSATVRAYTNLGASASLYINGENVGSASPSNGVLTWHVTLDNGSNDIEIRSTSGGKTYTQTATWNVGVGSSRASASRLANAATTTAAATAADEARTSRATDLFGSSSAIV